MFTQPSHPTLKMPKLKGKAAEICHFGGGMLRAWEKLAPETFPHYDLVHGALKCNVRMETIMDENRYLVVLPPSVHEEYKVVTFSFLQLQTHLNQIYAPQPRKLFQVTHKSHYVAEIALQSKFLNPAKSHCYQGEDFQKRMKQVGQACVKGSDAVGAGRKIMLRYSLGLHAILCDLPDLFKD